MELDYGDFGPAEEEILEKLGRKEGTYNIRLTHKMDMGRAEEVGVVSQDGLKAPIKSFMGRYHLEWRGEEEAEAEGTR